MFAACFTDVENRVVEIDVFWKFVRKKTDTQGQWCSAGCGVMPGYIARWPNTMQPNGDIRLRLMQSDRKFLGEQSIGQRNFFDHPEYVLNNRLPQISV